MARKTLAQQLEEKRLLIFNSSNPEIAQLLVSMGVDEPYLKNGENMYNQVLEQMEKQKKEQREESQAYDEYFKLKSECESESKKMIKLIKMASRADSDLQVRLGFSSIKTNRIESWINQNIEFYNNLLGETEFHKRIKRLGITPEYINAAKQKLESLRKLRNTAILEKGQAQEATRLRNVKMDDLEDYCYELKTIAEVALDDKPQLLESLGIIVRS